MSSHIRVTRTVRAVLLAWALAISVVIVSPHGAAADPVTHTRTLTPMEVGNAVVSQVGVLRGHHMTRESLDISVSGGAVIEARVTNGVGDVIISLMGDDHTTDVNSAALPTDGSWATITASAAGAVFARGRAWATAPQIEYRVTSGTEYATPTYRLGDSASTFVSDFSTGGSPFALLVDETFTMVIPRVDLPKVQDMSWSDFDDLDAVIVHYRSVLETFNDWLGIDDADPDPVHHDLPGAYMVRADRNGPGLAYYGPYNAVGTNNESVGYYLEGPESWLILHEIGHGYDGMMTGSSGPTDMHLGEVWNNVYAYLYQTLELGMTETNWLYRNGDKVNDQRIKDETRRAAGGLQFNSISVDVRLDFLARIADLTGTEGFRTFNRALREYRADTSFTGWPSRNDLVAEYWGQAQGHDLLPWFEQWNLPVSAPIVTATRDVEQFPMALPLGDYFADHATALTVADDLGLDSPGALVSTQDLQELAHMGTLTVAADITDPSRIENRTATLWAGDTQVGDAAFVNGDAHFGALPIGSYTLRLPQDRVTGTVPQREAVMVSAGGMTVTDVTYPATTAPSSVGGTLFSLQGLGDGTFSTVTHDPQARTFTITDDLGSPHVYFNDEYARITVADGSGQLFDRSFIGDQGRSGDRVTTVPAEIGTTLTLKHREWTGRLRETDPATGAPKPHLDATAMVTDYEVTEFGLVKVGGPSAEADFTAGLELALGELADTATAHPTARLEVQASGLRGAIDQLTDPAERAALLATHGDLLDALVAPAQLEGGTTLLPATLVGTLTSQPGAEAANMFDGDPGTWFHSPWADTETFPYNMDLDLGTDPVRAESLVMVPHVGGGSGADNGRPGQYRILAGDDLGALTEVASGTWANDASAKVVPLDVLARYVRLEIGTTYGNPAQRFVAVNELQVFGKPAHLDLAMTRTDSNGPTPSVGDVLTFSVTYTNNTSAALTAFPRTSNLSNVLPTVPQNCRYAGLGAGATQTCTFANHTLTVVDLAVGSFTPRVVFDATLDAAGTNIIQAGFVASTPAIPVAG